MNFKQCLVYLRRAAAKPIPATPAHDEWLRMKDFSDFLAAAAEEVVPLYVSWKGTYINTIIVPEVLLVGEFMREMEHWSFSVSDGWGWSFWRTAKGELRKGMESAVGHTGSEILSQGMTPVFMRYFEGRKLWDLRSKIAAHAGKEAPAEDLIVGFRSLAERVDKAMHALTTFIKDGGLNC